MKSEYWLILNTFVVLCILPVLLFFYYVPFNFYVDVKYVQYHDMCAGSDRQFVTALRDVHFSDGYSGSTKGELFRYVNDIKLETVIDRDRNFAYQISKEPVTYEIVWSKPIMEAGEYGASDLVTLDAPLFDKTEYFSEEDQRFNVIDCEPS